MTETPVRSAQEVRIMAFEEFDAEPEEIRNLINEYGAFEYRQMKIMLKVEDPEVLGRALEKERVAKQDAAFKAGVTPLQPSRSKGKRERRYKGMVRSPARILTGCVSLP